MVYFLPSSATILGNDSNIPPATEAMIVVGNREGCLDMKEEGFKGTSNLDTGLFIGGKFVEPVEPATIDIFNPTTGDKLAAIHAGSLKDVDIAVETAQKAYKTSWGLKVPGAERGKILNRLANLIKKHADELAALESLNVGMAWQFSKNASIDGAIKTARYFAGWADKVHGKTMETNELKFAYSRHEPYGVVAMILPWNVPMLLTLWKIAPALATGNTMVLKPSEITPLTTLRLCQLINEAGVPPGVVNIVNGYGHTVGEALSLHPGIQKIAFTGSTLTGRKILKASADSNLKNVTLELGGKSPAIIFDDADVEQAVKWVARGIFLNAGQVCVAGSRIFVQEGIYDKFLEAFTAAAKGMEAASGDPLSPQTLHQPQVSKTQYDRVMSCIAAGVESGASLKTGGSQLGTKGYFIQPTIFTDASPDSKIAKEEIFGPVGTVFKFKTEEEVIERANDTLYGLACHIFTENSARAIRTAHAIEAGTAWVNCALWIEEAIPFGGYKQSGIGREMGEYALETYTQVKGVHINLGLRL